MNDYGVVFDAHQAEKFDRMHIAVRVLILFVLTVLAGAIGWLAGLIYLGVPVLAAVLIAQKGPAQYLSDANNNMTKWLRFIIGFYAYLSLLTDRLPSETGDNGVRFEVRPSGNPTPGEALLRILLALPSVVVLVLLWLMGVVLMLIAAISVMANETYPSGVYEFLRGLNRWQARLLAYLASLVQEYPPFSLDTGSAGDTATPHAGH